MWAVRMSGSMTNCSAATKIKVFGVRIGGEPKLGQVRRTTAQHPGPDPKGELLSYGNHIQSLCAELQVRTAWNTHTWHGSRQCVLLIEDLYLREDQKETWR